MKLTILHISDLHMKKDELPYFQEIARGMLKDLDRLKSEHSLKPDFVFFTGDLINKGQNADEEFPLVEQHIIIPLLKNLCLTSDHLFMIPGNHEVDRHKLSEHAETGFEQLVKDKTSFQRYYTSTKPESLELMQFKQKLDSFFAFKSKFPNKHLVKNNFFSESYIVPFESLQIGIIGLNSAWRSSHFGHDSGRLIVGEPVVQQALESIAHCDIKICLCHHPFEMLCAWDRKPVRNRLANGAHLLFNGHVHESDITYCQMLLGNLFTSTCGSLKSGDLFSHYSIIQWDLPNKSITGYLRKWYSERFTFDQETERCKDGVHVLRDFECSSEKAQTLIEVSELRSNLIEQNKVSKIIIPIEGIDEVDVHDVFVVPLITDKSSFDKNREDANTFKINDLIDSGDNMIFFGREEYGKTTLLNYIKDYVLTNEKRFEDKIPVFLPFQNLPKTNLKALVLHICREICRAHGEKTIEQMLIAGRFIFLIDDFFERTDTHRDNRTKILREFHTQFPKCRFIFTMNEYISNPYQLELVIWNQEFAAKNYYISSFNTARIRELLIKWSSYQKFDVEGMLKQVLHYFQHFQIPVTPLAITLFIGVLFRTRKRRAIRNEAYLIENYLETILEKLKPDDAESGLDFKEKESFLAYIALQMLNDKKFIWTTLEFEKAKLGYFEFLDEDVPDAVVFESFFERGIFHREDGKISFKFKFWFNFFLAKAMEKNPEVQLHILSLKHYLNYSTALAYKAGLVRNDMPLLEEIDRRTQSILSPFFQKHISRQFSDGTAYEAMQGFTKQIEDEIKSKNSQTEADKRNDEMFLNYEEDDGTIEAEEAEVFATLITLNSDLIRNTSEIDPKLKATFLSNNVNAYIGLMWEMLEGFRDFVAEISEKDIENLFYHGRASTSTKQKIRIVVKATKRLVYQIVPISMILYMIDHLATPKLNRTIKRILGAAKPTEVQEVFYVLLLFPHDFSEAFQRAKKLVVGSNSAILDFIIYTYLRCYCIEHVLSHQSLEKVLNLLEDIRKRYPRPHAKADDYLKDTFKADIKRQILKHNS